MEKNETINCLKKYADMFGKKTEYERLKNCLGRLNETTVSIANTGVISSGKSSLYNVLLDSYEEGNERFQIGAARKTISCDYELLTDGVELIDTPGIDVTEQDDEEALKALSAASILLFIHNVKMGDITKNEADWIAKIRTWYGSEKEISDRMVLVISWIDERIDENTYDDTVSYIKRQVFQILGTEIECYCVSSKLYLEGKEQKEQLLIQMSGIDVLRERLCEKARYYEELYGNEAVRQEYRELCDAFSLILKERLIELNSQKERIHKELDLEYQEKKKVWSNQYKKFQSYHTGS